MTALTREQELDAITVVLRNRQPEDTDEQVAERVIDTLSMAQPKYQRDAPDTWDDSVLPGGQVCGECGMPTESMPCEEHQPDALAVSGDEHVLLHRQGGHAGATNPFCALCNPKGPAASQGDEGLDVERLRRAIADADKKLSDLHDRLSANTPPAPIQELHDRIWAIHGILRAALAAEEGARVNVARIANVTATVTTEEKRA